MNIKNNVWPACGSSRGSSILEKSCLIKLTTPGMIQLTLYHLNPWPTHMHVLLKKLGKKTVFLKVTSILRVLLCVCVFFLVFFVFFVVSVLNTYRLYSVVRALRLLLVVVDRNMLQDALELASASKMKPDVPRSERKVRSNSSSSIVVLVVLVGTASGAGRYPQVRLMHLVH